MTRTDFPQEMKSPLLGDPRFKTMDVDWARIATQGAAWLKRWQADVFVKEKLAP